MIFKKKIRTRSKMIKRMEMAARNKWTDLKKRKT